MKLSTVLAGSILVLASACTPRPGSIAPIAMTGAFDHLSCSKARNELNSERVKLAALEQKQNGAATADAIGVFLVLVPVSKLTGGDNAGEIGTSKGAVLALEQRIARCG
ncbi:MAG: hypothetical protein OSA82_13490 [Paracoccaceae bacterium]|nr:hypothetical protein [Paracoccaceae bacterium]